SSNRRSSVRHSTFESLRLGLSSQSIASGFLRFWDSLNFKKDREFVGITVLFLDEKVTSVMDSSLPRIALTMVSGKKKILLLKKDRDNPVLFAEMFLCDISELSIPSGTMEANFSGNSSTSRQNQKIDVGGRLIKGILQRSETA
ncbi:LOW QUALITY PROTEIN: hypothetical protein HID58_080192, partial [Brassica napus]